MSDALEGLSGAADELTGVAKVYSVGYVLWGALHDAELDYARAAIASFAEDQDLRHEAAMRRSEKLRAIGSEATFFSGLARIDGELRSIRVAVTPTTSSCSTTGRTSIPIPNSHASHGTASPMR